MTSTSKPQIPENTYQQLMEATLRTLCKHGYSDLRVRDIDDEFEKSRQLINHYYHGKDDLINAVLKYLIEEYEQGIVIGENGDPAQQLDSYIHQLLYGPGIEGADHWEFIMALNELRSHAQHYPDQQDLLRENYQHVKETLVDIIERGIEEGTFRDVDAEQFAIVIDDIIDSARMRKVCLGDDEAVETGHEALDNIILSQLLRNPDDSRYRSDSR